MLSAFLSAFRTPDLRKKILFTGLIIAVYRLGATLPSPGVSFANVQQCITILQGAGLIPSGLTPDMVADFSLTPKAS